MAEIILMPSLSPTMEDGVLESWVVKVGDFIEEGGVLANIETDKALVEYEVIGEGYIRHLFFENGQNIVVGQPIAIISEDKDEDISDAMAEAKAVKSVAPASVATEASAPTSAPEPASTSTPAIADSGSYDYDVAVIGAGPGGYVAAIRAAQLGLKTAIIEKEYMGGVCLNIGCIPTKALLKNADIIHTLKHRGEELGFSASNIKVDYAQAVKRSRKVSGTLTGGIDYLCKKNKIAKHMATAKFMDKHTLELTDAKNKTSKLTAKNFIIATGATARDIPNIVTDGKKIVNYKHAILQEKLPKSVVVIGSGAIGVEFSTIWNAYGSKITIVEMLPKMVPLEDDDVSKQLEKSFKKQGIDIRTNTKVDTIKTTAKGVEVTITTAKGTEVIKAEQALVSIGFAPNIMGIGLENAGVTASDRGIEIDDNMRTNVDNIFAIGDVTAKLMLAHVGSAQGVLAAEVIAGHTPHKLDYEMMPRATYCHPQIASMGITESQAKERSVEVKIAQFPFSANGKALGMGESDGFVKIITEAKYGEILGAHFIGPDVTELLPEFTLAQANELTIDEIGHNVHAHPTLSEVIMEAAHGLMGGYIHI